MNLHAMKKAFTPKVFEPMTRVVTFLGKIDAPLINILIVDL